MADIIERLGVDFPYMDEDAAALADMPLPADRMTYHTKRLRVVCYVDGIEGARAYKAKFPEAKAIQVKATTFAFQPKPKGYSDFLCNLVDAWFLSDTALAETNRADVKRLNQAMHPRRFNPDNHFTKPLSASLIGRLAEVFAKHGVDLDTRKAISMSQVRAAAKAAKGRRSAGKPFGGIGHIAGDTLIVGDQSFRIEDHNGHACIRIMVGGSRVRLRLDALAEFIRLVGLGALEKSPSILLRSRIGDLAPGAESEPEIDPLTVDLPENWPQPSTAPATLPGDLAPEPSGPPSLSERIAALKHLQQPHSTASTDGPDPLAL